MTLTSSDHASTPPRPADAPVGATASTMWLDVCRVDDLLPGRGVAALVGGVQVAVFRLVDGSVHALANRDPFSGANVLSRGITAQVGGRAAVASPVYKQRFDLLTGECLTDPDVRVPVHPVKVVDQQVFVGITAAR
jgi:nitrite reductase (NADH) small subunit